MRAGLGEGRQALYLERQCVELPATRGARSNGTLKKRHRLRATIQ